MKIHFQMGLMQGEWLHKYGKIEELWRWKKNVTWARVQGGCTLEMPKRYSLSWHLSFIGLVCGPPCRVSLSKTYKILSLWFHYLAQLNRNHDADISVLVMQNSLSQSILCRKEWLKFTCSYISVKPISWVASLFYENCNPYGPTWMMPRFLSNHFMN